MASTAALDTRAPPPSSLAVQGSGAVAVRRRRATGELPAAGNAAGATPPVAREEGEIDAPAAESAGPEDIIADAKKAASWQPDPDAAHKVSSALDSIAAFEAKWKDFQNRFDSLNRQMLQRLGTALLTPDDTTEYKEEIAEVEKKAKEAATLIKNASKVMVLTGAGISTSAGICDYRGPQGKWTLQAKGMKAKTRPLPMLIPTSCHMALRRLVEVGKVQLLVSTNTDGLHRHSGVPEDVLVECHGNSFVERCKPCDVLYERPFSVGIPGVKSRRTGGACARCRGPLTDTIVNFGQSLPEAPWKRVQAFAQDECDLLVVLGTSVRVAPVMHLPGAVVGNEKKGKLCLVNKQKTGADHMAAVHCHATTDMFMQLVMEALELDTPYPPPPRETYTLADKLAWRKQHDCLYGGPLEDGPKKAAPQEQEQGGDIGDSSADRGGFRKNQATLEAMAQAGTAEGEGEDKKSGAQPPVSAAPERRKSKGLSGGASEEKETEHVGKTAVPTAPGGRKVSATPAAPAAATTARRSKSISKAQRRGSVSARKVPKK